MVKTKSVNEPIEILDGIRILVSLYPVRKQKNIPPFVMEKARELAPSAELLNDWKEKRISWGEYESRYLKEMLGQRQKEKIKELAERSKHETITLLCFEPEGDLHCHRYLLRQLIENEERNIE